MLYPICHFTIYRFNRPNFLVLKKDGIGSERFSKKLLWKIFNIYMVVICHNRFFQKRVTKKNFFFRDPFLLNKKGVSEIDERNVRNWIRDAFCGGLPQRI